MNRGEERLCDYKNDRSGDFFKMLFKTMFLADPMNLERLWKGFPEEARAVYRYRTEQGYWEKLDREWKAKHRWPLDTTDGPVAPSDGWDIYRDGSDG